MSKLIKAVPAIDKFVIGNEMKSTLPKDTPVADVVALPKLRMRPHISTPLGYCAYKAAVVNGFKGTKDEWFNSLGYV